MNTLAKPGQHEQIEEAVSPRQFEAMLNLSTLLNSSLEEDEVRERAISAARQLVDCEASSLLFVNEETGGLYFDVAAGLRGARVRTIQLKKGQGIAGWVAQNRESIIIPDAQQDPRLYKQADKASGFRTRSMLCVPVGTRNKFIGVLQALNKNHQTFDETDERLLSILANQIAVALENARLYHDLKDSLHSVIHVLADTIEQRDPFAGGHAKRVAKYSVAMGQEMGLNKTQLVNLKLAALLHDLGMISLPDELVRKRSRLTPMEKDVIMKHVVLGSELLSSVKHLRPLLPVIKYHHETYDGRGPFHLSGDEIPLHSRIIAVADAFDAMTNDRPYRLCLGYDAAIRELKDQAGRQFDPEVVKAFVNSHTVRMARRFYHV